MEIQVIQIGSNKAVATLSDISPTSTIKDVKKQIHKIRKNLYPARQSLKLDPKGKALDNEVILKSLKLPSGNQLYFKDMGPQIGWKTVFLLEYFGPLVLYLVSYFKPAIFYGEVGASQPRHFVVHAAACCWAFHYIKRILETLFVHRFSHATMPLKNLFKNCSYYWLFGLYIGYYVNHPLYTPPVFGDIQMYLALAGFVHNELGNLSIHVALRNLRPAGSTERKIPVPTLNPYTHLFNVVSCPNYTYEVLSWVSFTVMTQCLPAGFFTLAGFYQMSLWALQKHRSYKKDFAEYPKNRKAILPFLL